ncbi:splicing factor u2af large subunit [Aspergillus undulatus]|uniref:splicing factor u2af large subunit n=1 Tax=Aspergillus undulatus TaxID=1810928 RepID=UPI003CCD40E5
MNGDNYSSRGGDSGRSRDYYRDERRERGDRGERRRSRSPHYGSRSSRREAEADSYSSSRDYRAREREDRYSSRRDDRDYDRDRGDRRRREFDERPSRRERDRDLFDERPRRERGERGDRGDRGGGERRERERKRSPSPARKREPTPDLTDVQSVLTRRRRLTQWDIKPPGYENVTAEQAKLSGMFPLPGAPRQQPMDPSRLQAFMNQPGGGSADTSALKPSHSRQSKRLFVYSLPPNVTPDALVSFFNLQLNGLNVIQGIDPCISAQISDDRAYALLEFKSPNDTTVALAFDGIIMEDHVGNGAENGASKGLEVRRPKDYIVPNLAEQDLEGDTAMKDVPDSPNKICVSNIPQYIPEEPVTMLLKSFGELKSFVLVKDASTEESRGIAFCEYADPATTTIAVQGLNGMELGDRHLKVVRASIGQTQAAGLDMGVNAMSMFAKTTSQDLESTRVLQLLNMVTPEELMDNEDYEEICDDVHEECSKFGRVIELKIPRPTGGSRQSPGVGKIFVKFETVEATTAALKSLAGRKFSDRTVVTTYFSEENFDVNAW